MQARYATTQQQGPGQARAARGFSLLELMIASILGLIVLLGIITVFGSSRSAYQMGDANARLQENIRFSLEILRPEIRESASAGLCAGQLRVTNSLRQDCGDLAQNDLFGPDAIMIGWEAQGTAPGATITITGPASLQPVAGPGAWQSGRWVNGALETVNLPAFLNGRVVPNTDFFIVRTLVPQPLPTGCTANLAGTGAISTCDRNNDALAHGIAPSQLALLTNCATHAQLFQNRSTNTSEFSIASSGCAAPGPSNRTGASWARAWRDDTQLYRVDVTAYYIGWSVDRQQPGLYRVVLSRGLNALVFEELVEGIENMQLLYGLSLPTVEQADARDDGRSIDVWVPASQVADWTRVLAVRLALLVRSPDPADPVQATGQFDLYGLGVNTPADRRLRQVATSTISLRNRVQVP